jgi:hypothetical protein
MLKTLRNTAGAAVGMLMMSSLTASLSMIEPEKIIVGWRKGIQAAQRHEHDNDADVCLYGTLICLLNLLVLRMTG